LETSLLLKVINILIKSRNTQIFGLYTQAVETHIAAIGVFIQLVELNEMLIQKYWNSSHG
jgi:hypothetical protein